MPAVIWASVAYVVTVTVAVAVVVGVIQALRAHDARAPQPQRPHPRQQQSPHLQHPQALPAVHPAWMLDASDTSDECPACYIEHLQRGQLPRHEDGSYLAPAGAPVICARHRASPLARAIRRYVNDENERKATR